MDTPELSQQKADLRKAMKPVRRAAFDENPNAESALKQQLDAFFEGYEAQNGGYKRLIIGGYAPIQSEFPLISAMKSLENKGHQLCLPLVVGANTPLDFLNWQSGQPLIEGAFGTRAPDPEVADVVTPDVMLVPLLAFDDKAFRLGYGGGFYDRSIALYKPKLTIGIAFSSQRVNHVPIGSYDLALTCIMTEKGLAVSNL
ncbi:MAG: 5-formyltetrahydrofolate cyclo-ligase [Alphaproteobacteria bacterium]